jgi:hypothetical protein
MVDILLLQTLSIAVASGGVFVAATYHALQIRQQTRLRKTDLVMRMYSHFGSREFQDSWQKIMNAEFKDYDDFMKNYGTADAWSVFMFFGGMGLLVYNERAYLSVVDQLVSGPVKITWEKMKPVIEGYRKQYDQPQFCEWFEYLYDEMEKRGKRLKFGKREREGASHG